MFTALGAGRSRSEQRCDRQAVGVTVVRAVRWAMIVLSPALERTACAGDQSSAGPDCSALQ